MVTSIGWLLIARDEPIGHPVTGAKNVQIGLVSPNSSRRISVSHLFIDGRAPKSRKVAGIPRQGQNVMSNALQARTYHNLSASVPNITRSDNRTCRREFSGNQSWIRRTRALLCGRSARRHCHDQRGIMLTLYRVATIRIQLKAVLQLSENWWGLTEQ